MIRQKIASTAPNVVAHCATAIGIPPGGTITAGGALTLAAALHSYVFAEGIWLYFPAGAIVGDATGGFYFTVMSSTTVGTVYTAKYIPGSTSWEAPTSLVAAVGSGSAYSGTTAEITVASQTIPGGTLGNHGFGRSSIMTTRITGGAFSTNLVFLRLNGELARTISAAASNNTVETSTVVSNAGVPNVQKIIGATVATRTACDTTQDFVVTLSISNGSVTSPHILEYFIWEASNS